MATLSPAELSIAAYKTVRDAEKAETDRHLAAIAEVQARKEGRDDITSAYLRTLPGNVQRRLLRMSDKKFRKAIQPIARRAHALHESGTFVLPETGP